MSTTGCRGEDACYAVIISVCAVEPRVITHDPISTVDQHAVIASAWDFEHVLTKNMFLKGKKSEMVLVVALADTKTDLKLVGKAVGCNTLRFAQPEVLSEVLGVTQGCVSPLALVNDAEKKVIVVLDAAMDIIGKTLCFHPCRNDKTTFLQAAELNKFLETMGNKVIKVDFSSASSMPAKGVEVKTNTPSTASNVEELTETKTASLNEKVGVNHSSPAEKKISSPKEDVKRETKLCINVKKNKDFASWYTQVITKSDMIEYYDVGGCYILRPWSFGIWNCIRVYFSEKIHELGIEECYFPMFISKAALEREKDHVKGFAPEVAWVTKSGDDDIENPIAIRPTSETAMYPYFAKWIRSYRDLPVRLNQWCNIVRWEFSNPTPFIRTREFLWQEGHCAWARKEECDDEIRVILSFYASVYEHLLAIPVVQGIKTEKEKFPGGLYTLTVETFIPSVGRGCQGGTSHALGQNFGKIFDISFEDPDKSDGSKLIPWQNSWGLTTRTIGIMVMVHGDDIGLILPPRVAQVQVVIIPVGITAKTTPEQRAALTAAATELQATLKKAGVRAKADLRDNYSPGWRFNYWELRGVPIRIEVGPKELAKKKLVCCVRHNGEKRSTSWNELEKFVPELLDEIHHAMYKKSKVLTDEYTMEITEWANFVPALNNNCRIMAPWCGEQDCEDAIKKDSADESKNQEDERAPNMGAKSLCIPFEQPHPEIPIEKYNCIRKGCKSAAKQWGLWGRSY